MGALVAFSAAVEALAVVYKLPFQVAVTGSAALPGM